MKRRPRGVNAGALLVCTRPTAVGRDMAPQGPSSHRGTVSGDCGPGGRNCQVMQESASFLNEILQQEISILADVHGCEVELTTLMNTRVSNREEFLSLLRQAKGEIHKLVETIQSSRSEMESSRRRMEDRLNNLANMAYLDALTGLANRRAFQERHSHQRDGAILALVDIDHFKSINDTYGHDAGDQALRAFAQVLQSSIRDEDRIYRLGGEEFVLVLANTDIHSAVFALNRIREHLQDTCIPVGDDGADITLKFSAGLFRLDGELPVEDALRHADAALYGAKHAGRDQSCVWTPAGLEHEDLYRERRGQALGVGCRTIA